MKSFSKFGHSNVLLRRRVLVALGYCDLQTHRGIIRYAREAGWILDTSMTHYGEIPSHWHGDGVIAIFMDNRPDLTRFVRQQNVPVVALSCDVQQMKVGRVVADDIQIGRLAAEHFIERQFIDLGFYKFSNVSRVQGREEGFRRSVERAGRNYHLIDWYNVSQRNLIKIGSIGPNASYASCRCQSDHDAK